LSTSSARFTASGAGICAARLRVHDLTKQLGRQIEIDAAGTARDGGTDCARDTDTDVRGMQNAICGLAEGLRDGKLVHLFVIALLKIDDLAFGRAGDEDRREAVGGGVSERGETIEEAGRRHGEADAGLLGQKTGDRRRIAGVLLVAKREDADARGLRHAAEVRDRDSGHAIDRVESIELERIDNEVKAVGQLALCVGCRFGGGLCLHCCVGHGNPPCGRFLVQIVGIARHVVGKTEGVVADQIFCAPGVA
jgi:hypothetical protein